MRLAALLVALALAACADAPRSDVVELRVIAFNDFHGYLEAPAPGGVGGVAHLATAIRTLKEGHGHTIVVAAGDLVGASPIASALFHDEPTVRALADAGLEVSSVGNHEFDHGRAELLRLQGLAGFQWLAANVIDTASARPLLPAYEIREYDGIKVAFVGVVLHSTPQMVTAAGVKGLEFRDEARTVNDLVPGLRARGVEAIVVLIHEGGRSQGAYDDAACPGFAGAIVGIMERLDPAVDLVVSGHTHEAYMCRVGGRLVTSAGSYGRYVTSIDLTLDRRTRDVVGSRAALYPVETARFPADPRIAAYVAQAVARASAEANRAVGTLDGELTTLLDSDGESTLGQLVADSQLAAMREIAGVQVAFMNPGGIRAPLAGRGPEHAVTFADLYAVQPFGNTLVAMTLTGAQIADLLEQQWRTAPGVRPRILHVSSGFSYSWDGARPVGSRVVPGSIAIGGRAVDPDAKYRVAVNSFLAGAGDGFAVLATGEDVVGGPVDVAAFEDFMRGRALRARAPERRITRVD